MPEYPAIESSSGSASELILLELVCRWFEVVTNYYELILRFLVPSFTTSVGDVLKFEKFLT